MSRQKIIIQKPIINTQCTHKKYKNYNYEQCKIWIKSKNGCSDCDFYDIK